MSTNGYNNNNNNNNNDNDNDDDDDDEKPHGITHLTSLDKE
jgi:hypothetical protein